MQTLIIKLHKIQKDLKAPKNQYNAFAKFNYRSCEDIVEAIKPLLDGAVLLLTDEVVNVGTHNYIKATAIIKDGKEEISAVGYAREAEMQKGMNDAQLTGSSSSYARKYALNGLFAIDDTKDADTKDNTKPAIKANEINQVAKDRVETGDKLECHDCGALINKAIHAFSTSKFKKPLCMDCQKTQ